MIPSVGFVSMLYGYPRGTSERVCVVRDYDPGIMSLELVELYVDTNGECGLIYFDGYDTLTLDLPINQNKGSLYVE